VAVGYVRESAWAAWRLRLFYALLTLAWLSLVAFVVTGITSIAIVNAPGRSQIDCGTLFAPASDPLCRGVHDDDLPLAFAAAIAVVVLALLAVLVIRIKPTRKAPAAATG